MTNNHYYHSKRVLITGATSGIGAELARQLIAHGANVVLVGRNNEALDHFLNRYPESVVTLCGDLNECHTIDRLRTTITELGIDIAILNAGIAAYDDDRRFNAATCHRIFKTNVESMVNCIDAVLPSLLSRQGQLVLMSSVAAYGGLPIAAAYCASKAAIRTLAQSLDLDLRPQGVPVTCVCPGFVQTPLTDRNTFPMPFRLPVDDACRRILIGIQDRRHEVAFPKKLAWILKVITSLPASWQYSILSWTTQPGRIR